MPRIVSIERIWVDLPFKEVPARNNVREIPHWSLLELCKVTLDTGEIGVGETMPYYTYFPVPEEAVRRAMGADPARIMWDDSLGAGLQMACFDAVGRALDTPVWALLGRKVKSRAMVGWWAIDMPAEDWISECREAIASGYTTFKTKARPWFDLEDQLVRLCAAVPRHFKIDMDFNDFGLDPAIARPLCKMLEKFPQVAIWESPIRQEDVEGTAMLRRHLSIPIAHHAKRPQLSTQLMQGMCDGFVLEGGVANAVAHATICAEFNRPFWLQWVGTNLTATFGLHLQAVMSHARWPAIHCQHMFAQQYAVEPFPVHNGLAEIPDRAGIGVTIDWDVVERYRVEPQEKPYPHPDLLLRLDWPSGATSFFAHAQQMWTEFGSGELPAFVPGVNLVRVPNDGTKEWRKLYEAALAAPVHGK